MARTTAPAFTLQVGPHAADSLVVVQFSGSESLSRLYDFRVEFFEKDGQLLELSELPGTPALLSIRIGEAPVRHVHGLVRRAEALGHKGGRWRYRVQVVPKLERLCQIRKSRIFQEKAVPDIVKAVLGEAGVEHRLALSGSYTAREYCVQYRESDFDFISRLLESEGIFYFFEHAEGSHTLVLGDAANAHVDLPGGAKLPLRADDARAYDEEFISGLERVHRLRPGAVMLRDFDFVKPALDLSTTSTSAEGVGELELYDYPAEYVAPGVGKSLSKVRMEEKAQGAQTYTGRSLCPRLGPGYLFEVGDLPEGTFSGQYLLEEVTHSGQQPDTLGNAEMLGGLYRNEFRCLPKAVPFRPLRVTPRPHVPGVQTATVVGPSGEEIHTDEHGRIKVQFHWDREGKQDDKSSCWVRVGQAWGGLAWGALYLPRIGQEVLIRFLEGNPDRPLIAGAVYNGDNPTPYELPVDRTKSTLRSASSLGSAGFNEFRIEDAAGQEELFIHGQKDEELLTENNKTQEVRAHEALWVKKNRQRIIEGHQRLLVGQADAARVDGNQTLQVRGNRSTLTRGDHDETVEGHQAITVNKNQKSLAEQAAAMSVGGAAALTIGAAYAVNVGLAMNEAVGGLKSREIAGALSELTLGSRQELVTGNAEYKTGDSLQTEVLGQVSLTLTKDLKEQVGQDFQAHIEEQLSWAAKSFSLEADKLSIIVNGKLIFSFEKSGKVQLFAKTFTLEGSQINIKGGKVKKEAAGSLIDRSVSIKKPEKLEPAKPGPIELNLKDVQGKPLADQPYEVKLPDGTIKKGRLDKNGHAKLSDLPVGKCQISFPELEGGISSS